MALRKPDDSSVFNLIIPKEIEEKVAEPDSRSLGAPEQLMRGTTKWTLLLCWTRAILTFNSKKVLTVC